MSNSTDSIITEMNKHYVSEPRAPAETLMHADIYKPIK